MKYYFISYAYTSTAHDKWYYENAILVDEHPIQWAKEHHEIIGGIGKARIIEQFRLLFYKEVTEDEAKLHRELS